jgi:hypothetical protein
MRIGQHRLRRLLSRATGIDEFTILLCDLKRRRQRFDRTLRFGSAAQLNPAALRFFKVVIELSSQRLIASRAFLASGFVFPHEITSVHSKAKGHFRPALVTSHSGSIDCIASCLSAE